MIALIEEYQKELLQIACYAEDTVKNYVSCIVMYCAWLKKCFGISPISAQGSHVCLWIMEIKKKGLSYSRLEYHRSALKTFYAMLVNLKMVQKNIAAVLPQFRRRGKSQVEPVSKETVFKLLAVVDQSSWEGKRNYMIISMLWALGLRISELTGLSVGSFEPGIDPKNEIGLLRVRGKNRKQRALFVVDRLYRDLTDYLNHPQSPKHKQDPLFPVRSGNAISNNRIQKKFKEYCREAGIKERLTPHVLRHSFATEMYNENVPLEIIQSMMGHSSKGETAVYIKVADDFKKEALYQLVINRRMPWE